MIGASAGSTLLAVRRQWLRAALLLACWLFAAATGASGASVWLDASDRPTQSAREALRLLADAATDGLDSRDYRAAELAGRAVTLIAVAGASASPSPTAFSSQAMAAGAFAADLDAAMLSFLHDLRFGRVDPHGLGFRITRSADAAPDLAALLYKAAAEQRLAQAVADMRPRLPQYGRLRTALARYRALVADTTPDTVPATATLKPGAAFDGATALRRRLVALGDLPADAPPSAGRYDTTLAEGVRRFQSRHGLAADGVIGRSTWAALNVPLEQRVRQLELALERLRWLPDPTARPFVGVNIPMFRLWAWDPATPATAPIDMNVVVGRALNTQTPVLGEEMRYLEFRPYWNVPRSIVHNEILPKLARDPTYLQRNDMEIVRGGGDDARPVAASGANLELLRQGVLRVRQRPGPKNSLGLVKFIFPNDANVYLHGTPATQLFGNPRRDFSHGCVRVEDPVTLAQWVLRDQPRWTRERIEAAMAGPAPVRVDLLRPLPVILFYVTAMVMPADQALHFAPDIYGHDTRLERALARRRP